jgi:hypothetical protein
VLRLNQLIEGIKTTRQSLQEKDPVRKIPADPQDLQADPRPTEPRRFEDYARKMYADYT